MQDHEITRERFSRLKRVGVASSVVSVLSGANSTKAAGDLASTPGKTQAGGQCGGCAAGEMYYGDRRPLKLDPRCCRGSPRKTGRRDSARREKLAFVTP